MALAEALVHMQNLCKNCPHPEKLQTAWAHMCESIKMRSMCVQAKYSKSLGKIQNQNKHM